MLDYPLEKQNIAHEPEALSLEENHYQTLQVTFDKDEEVIKEMFEEYKKNNNPLAEKASITIRKLEAYRVLMDKKRRAEYNQRLYEVLSKLKSDTSDYEMLGLTPANEIDIRLAYNQRIRALCLNKTGNSISDSINKWVVNEDIRKIQQAYQALLKKIYSELNTTVSTPPSLNLSRPFSKGKNHKTLSKETDQEIKAWLSNRIANDSPEKRKNPTVDEIKQEAFNKFENELDNINQIHTRLKSLAEDGYIIIYDDKKEIAEALFGRYTLKSIKPYVMPEKENSPERKKAKLTHEVATKSSALSPEQSSHKSATPGRQPPYYNCYANMFPLSTYTGQNETVRNSSTILSQQSNILTIFANAIRAPSATNR